MKLEVDFIKQFENEEKELQSIERTPPTQEEWDKLHLTQEMVDLKLSQYERIKNEDKWKVWVEYFYPIMCQNAEIQGGRVTLDINEESLVGKLTYLGHDLIINNVFCRNLKTMTYMLALTEEYFIGSKDGLVELQFIFHLFDKKKISDYSEGIDCLKKQIFSPEYIEMMMDEDF